MTNTVHRLHVSRPVNANRGFVELGKSDPPNRTDQESTFRQPTKSSRCDVRGGPLETMLTNTPRAAGEPYHLHSADATSAASGGKSEDGRSAASVSSEFQTSTNPGERD